MLVGPYPSCTQTSAPLPGYLKGVWAIRPVPFLDAVITNLTWWTDDVPDLSVLLKSFYETRDYFKFAGFGLFLHETLPAEAIDILIYDAMHFENDNDIVVFERP